MAKDPAILWYWGDWYSGTSLMSRFLKGCYIDLLHAQFNNGPLSLEEIKICLGSDFGQSWPALQKKFKQTENLFFNERLEREKEKRNAFTESRRLSRLGKTNNVRKTCVKHTIQRMENTNENENTNEIIKGKSENQFPYLEEVQRIFHQQGGTEEMATAFFNRYEAVQWKIRGSPVLNFSSLVGTFITNWKTNKTNGCTTNSSSTARQRQTAASSAVTDDLKATVELLNRKGR